MEGIEQVQELREKTGAGVMECKRALEEAHGNFDDAVRILHERGIAKVAKRADRVAGAGMIKSYIHNDRIGVLLDLRAETDFVVHSDPFKALAQELVMQVAATNPQNTAELLAEPYIRDESRKVQDIVNDAIAKVGENILVNAFFRMEV